MATEASTQRETQEQSIKARKHELFVEEKLDNDGPKKRFREYVRETPAAPMSRNVKLILWGSAAPVVVLFIASLFSKGSSAKPPDYSVVGGTHKPAPAPVLAKASPARKDHPSPEATGPKEETPKAEGDSKPPEEQPKPKANKKNKNKKKKPADEAPKTEVAKNDEAPKKDETPNDAKVTKADESSRSGEPGKKPKPDSTANAEGKGKGTSTSPAPAPEPEKRKVSVFKKKKPPVFTYPKKTTDGEKKGEPEE